MPSRSLSETVVRALITALLGLSVLTSTACVTLYERSMAVTRGRTLEENRNIGKSVVSLDVLTHLQDELSEVPSLDPKVLDSLRLTYKEFMPISGSGATVAVSVSVSATDSRMAFDVLDAAMPRVEMKLAQHPSSR